MSKELAPRCSSVSHGPSAGPDWREVMTGTEETTGAAAAEMEKDCFIKSHLIQVKENDTEMCLLPDRRGWLCRKPWAPRGGLNI